MRNSEKSDFCARFLIHSLSDPAIFILCIFSRFSNYFSIIVHIPHASISIRTLSNRNRLHRILVRYVEPFGSITRANLYNLCIPWMTRRGKRHNFIDSSDIFLNKRDFLLSNVWWNTIHGKTAFWSNQRHAGFFHYFIILHSCVYFYFVLEWG